MKSMFESFIKEFKEFAIKGSVIDMAVGIIIGGAFSPIVNSLVKDIIMPPIGFILGKVDFSNLYLSITPSGLVTINYGLFINTLISFLIVSFAVFLLVKIINKLKAEKKEETCVALEVVTKECPFCYSTINIRAKRCPYCTSEL